MHSVRARVDVPPGCVAAQRLVACGDRCRRGLRRGRCPVRVARIPVGERAVVERELHDGALAGVERHLREPFELVRRADESRRDRLDVALHHFDAATVAGVLHRYVDHEGLAGREPGGRGRRSDRARRVRQAVPEREPHRQVTRVVPPVSDEYPFAVPVVAVLAGEGAERGAVLEAQGDRDRQAAAGLRVAGEDVDERVRHLLAPEPRLHHRTDVVDPVHGDRRTRVDHDDGVEVGRGDAAHQLVLLAGKVHRPRSRPSLSHSASLPTTTTTASAVDAIAASAVEPVGDLGEAEPIRTPRMIPGAVVAKSAVRSTDWPAARSSTTPRSSLAMPKSRPGGGGSLTPSNTRSPSMVPRLCPPIWVNVNVCPPDSSAVKRARTRIDIGSALPPRSPRMTTLPSSTCRSCGSPANSAFAKSSTARPGLPSGVVTRGPPSGGVARLMSQPRSKRISVSAPSRAREGVERADPVVRGERRGAAAHQLRLLRVGADHGEGSDRGLIEWEHTLVLEEDRRRHGCLAGECPVVGAVDRRALPRGGVVERADAFEHAEQPPHLRVDERLVDRAVTHGRRERRAEPPRRAGHLEVDPGGRGSDGRAVAVPVGDDEPLESPFATQDPVEELDVLRAVRSVQPVVPGHDPERAAFRHRELERDQDDLAELTRVDDRIHAVAFELRVVRREVLDRGRDPLRLDAPDEAGRDAPREERILRVALEVPAADWGAGHVDRRREQHPARLGVGFLAEHHADPLHEGGIPTGSQRRAAGHAGRGLVGQPEQPRAPRAVRPVRHHDRRDAQARHRGRRPHRVAGGERRLLVEGEIAHQLLDMLRHRLLQGRRPAIGRGSASSRAKGAAPRRRIYGGSPRSDRNRGDHGRGMGRRRVAHA